MSWETEAFIDFVAEQVGGAVHASRMAWNIYQDTREIMASNLPEDFKEAAVLLVILNEIGNPLPNNIPDTIENAYNLIYNTPDYVGGITKEELWDQLHQLAPEQFPQDVGGWLIPSDTLPNLEQKPRTQVDLPDPIEDSPTSDTPSTVATKFGQAESTYSPLVLDLDGDGIELTNLTSNAVYWDIDVDGIAESTAWVTGGDGLLAIDLNEDGVINDHSELFGDQTGSPNGFAALAAYDSNTDGYITSADTSWGDLVVWVDANGDGYSQEPELHTLDDLLITSIDLGYSTVNYTIAGNSIKQESSFTINGNVRDIVDAWFAVDQTNSIYSGTFELDPDVFDLPTARGYGDLPDLHVAMSQNEDLHYMVAEIAAATLEDVLDPTFDLESKVIAIMYEWAGVADVSANSRGANIDARKLEFLEEFVGREFSQTGANPGPAQAIHLEDAFGVALRAIHARITGQTALGTLLEGGEYNAVTDAFEQITRLSPDVFASIGTLAGTSGDPGYVWRQVSFMVENSGALDNLDPGDYASIVNAIVASANTDINGTSGNNTLEGTASYDALYGYAGNDTLNGNGGSDTLYGGTGVDTLRGNSGNDVYAFALGDSSVVSGQYDTVSESSGEGTDTILFGEGIAAEDVRLWTVNGGHLYIQYSGTDFIRVLASSVPGASTVGAYLERIVFADDTVWDFTNGLYLHNNDTGRTLYGSNYGDTIIGGAANDTLNGYAGNDVLTGDGGVDTLNGDEGDDTYVFELGDSPIISGQYDTFNESANEGTDTILFGEGIEAENVRLWTVTGNHLYIQYSANDFIRVLGSGITGASTIGSYLERMVFADGTVWDFTNGLYLHNNDTARTLYGSNNADTIIGGAANDILNGYAGNDVLTGGGGVDSLTGGTGDDTYVFNLGDSPVVGGGYEAVMDGVDGGTDTILFGEGVDAADVRLWTTTGDNLYIQYSGSDFVRVAGSGVTGASAIGERLERIVFADDTMWDFTGGLYLHNNDTGRTLYGSNNADTIIGGAANDILNGYAGNDVLTGGGGVDSLTGGTGDDTYVFNLGDSPVVGGGYEAVMDGVDGGTDTILFGEGVDAADVRLWTTTGDNLYIQYSGSDFVRVAGSGVTGASAIGERLERIVFADDTMWDFTGGLYLHNNDTGRTLYGSNNADTIIGGAGNDILNGYSGNDILLGGGGNDTLNGGDGNDTLYGNGGDTLNGNAGDDLYVHSTGLDTIADSGGVDTLWITGGTTVNDISFSNVSTFHTKITVTASSNEITVNNLRHGTASNHVDTILFDDGFYANLPSYASWMNGTSGNDTTNGNSSANVIIGKAGNDTIDGLGGNDNIHGGSGNDTIEGGDGDDLLHGGDGDDTLYGEDGLDTLFGGAGADTFGFQAASAFNNVDVVKDFATAQGDKLDINNIVDFDPMSDQISDFLTFTNSGGNSQMFVDRDGTGGTYSSVQVALLEGVTDLDADDLLSGGYLIAA